MTRRLKQAAGVVIAFSVIAQGCTVITGRCPTSTESAASAVFFGAIGAVVDLAVAGTRGCSREVEDEPHPGASSDRRAPTNVATTKKLV